MGGGKLAEVAELKQYQDTLVKEFVALKAAFAEASEVKDIAEEAFRQAEQNLWQHIQELGLSSLNRPDGNFVKSSQMYPSKPTGDNLEVFRQWAAENGKEEDLFTDAVRTTEFNQLVKGMLTDSGELPPGVEAPTVRQFITFRRK
jgi:hypothetical protein